MQLIALDRVYWKYLELLLRTMLSCWCQNNRTIECMMLVLCLTCTSIVSVSDLLCSHHWVCSRQRLRGARHRRLHAHFDSIRQWISRWVMRFSFTRQLYMYANGSTAMYTSPVSFTLGMQYHCQSATQKKIFACNTAFYNDYKYAL